MSFSSFLSVLQGVFTPTPHRLLEFVIELVGTPAFSLLLGNSIR